MPKQDPSRVPRVVPDAATANRFRGCLLGGAIGDSLGAAVEFMSLREIRQQFGANGITELATAYGRVGAITDDTQMTLFTAEGVLRGFVRARTRGICNPTSVTRNAYLRWLHTQGSRNPNVDVQSDGWLITNRELFSRRAPGTTCIRALETLGNDELAAVNDSKGCGGVMRVAPIGMIHAALGPKDQSAAGTSFDMAVEAAAITHGHVTGQLAAGAFAAIVCDVLRGESLGAAADSALRRVRRLRGSEETAAAIRAALESSASGCTPESIRALGKGWVAEEALAIGLHCALTAPDFRSGVIAAANHDGDSDSTASIAGNLLGATLGLEAFSPRSWLRKLELHEVIAAVADDLAAVGQWDLEDDCQGDYYFERYPGA